MLSEGWGVLAESAAGTSHIARGIVCQDVCRTRSFGDENDWIAIAISDGAGSAEHSQIGAGIVCDSFLSTLSRRWPIVPRTREDMLEFYTLARAEIFAEAVQRGFEPSALACTALLGIAGPECAMFGQLGDGAIVIGRDGEYRMPIWCVEGEYVNETEFITGNGYSEALQFAAFDERISEIAILTDGLQHLAIDFAERRPHAGFFQPFFESLRASARTGDLRVSLLEFLSSPRVNERTDDDKTLALAIRRP